jgi:mono/diheme cytochrome c family protein
MTNRLQRHFLSLAASALLILAPRAALAQEKLGAPPGKGSFMRYCASCHGADAKGDGPLANLLNQKPADLTLLAKRNNGNFPAQRVERIIDGREEVAVHGPRDMPVWGQRFGEAGEAAGQHTTQTAAREQIQLLLQYLNEIQQK